MDSTTFNVLSAVAFCIIGISGGVIALLLHQLKRPAVMRLALAVAAGVLISVAVVEMLPSASGSLEGVDISFSKAFRPGSNDAFPLGNTLFALGFAITTNIKPLLNKLCGHPRDRSQSNGRLATSLIHRSRQHDQLLKASHATDPRNTSGWAAFAGLYIQSVVDVAESCGYESPTFAFLLAISLRKGLVAFSLTVTNLSLWENGKRLLCVLSLLAFALSHSVGLIICVTGINLGGSGTGAIVCLTGGAVLSVGITELLLPALSGEVFLILKLVLFSMSLLGMSVLAVWS